MQSSNSTISSLSLEELEKHRDMVDERITFLKTSNIKEKIREDTKSKGFSCQVDFSEPVEGLEKYSLPYYILVYSYDRDKHTDPKFIEVSGEQYQWVDLLNFRGEPTKFSTWKLGNKWHCGNFIDPCYNTAEMMITVYLDKESPRYSEFGIIHKNSGVEKWEI
jgi:hypothetical protein